MSLCADAVQTAVRRPRSAAHNLVVKAASPRVSSRTRMHGQTRTGPYRFGSMSVAFADSQVARDPEGGAGPSEGSDVDHETLEATASPPLCRGGEKASPAALVLVPPATGAPGSPGDVSARNLRRTGTLGEVGTCRRRNGRGTEPARSAVGGGRGTPLLVRNAPRRSAFRSRRCRSRTWRPRSPGASPSPCGPTRGLCRAVPEG